MNVVILGPYHLPGGGGNEFEVNFCHIPVVAVMTGR